ncbi:hypothetical protein ACLKA7_000187 [Drosophila subpalustris]
MDILNNNDLIKLNMDDMNICNDNLNNCTDIFATAADNKENIQSEPIPVNWNNGSAAAAAQELTSFQASVPCKLEKEALNSSDQNLNKYEDIFAINQENIKSNAIPLNWNNADDDDDKDDFDLKPKLKMCWSICGSKDGNGNGDRNNDALIAVAPKAYTYQEVYQSRKQKALQQKAEEERKAREFHSRPVPNFKALHKHLEEMRVVHKITVPVTPETVKHSIADRERRKRKEHQQQQQQQQQQVGAFNTKHLNTKVGSEQTNKLEMRPFHLRADQRVRERREYDASVQHNMAQKMKESIMN